MWGTCWGWFSVLVYRCEGLVGLILSPSIPMWGTCWGWFSVLVYRCAIIHMIWNMIRQTIQWSLKQTSIHIYIHTYQLIACVRLESDKNQSPHQLCPAFSYYAKHSQHTSSLLFFNQRDVLVYFDMRMSIGCFLYLHVIRANMTLITWRRCTTISCPQTARFKVSVFKYIVLSQPSQTTESNIEAQIVGILLV